MAGLGKRLILQVAWPSAVPDTYSEGEITAQMADLLITGTFS